MKVAVIQAAPVYLDTKATTAKALALMREAAANGAELCAFPEVFISGYPIWLRPNVFAKYDDAQLKAAHAAYAAGAVAADGPEMAALCEEAAKLDLFTTIGFMEPTVSGASVYCSLAAIHPERGLVGVHRKIKPTFHERLIWADGDAAGLKVHEWRGVNVGGLCCYENWQPVARYALYAQGEHLHVAAWPGRPDLTEDITRFVAMEGRVYVLSPSGVLHAKDIPDAFPLKKHMLDSAERFNTGGSMICGPDGEVLQGPVVDEEVILYADFEMERVVEEHLRLDPAGHYNRPDLFTVTVDTQRRKPLAL